MTYRKCLNATVFPLALVASFYLVYIFSSVAYAADNIGATAIDGRVYSFDEETHYEYSSSESYEDANPSNTYGNFSIVGSLASDGSKDGIPSFLVTGETATLVYSYTDDILNADIENYHLVEDKTKQVDGVSLPSKISYGALILQTSKDGQIWYTDLTMTNLFKETPIQSEAFYSANSLQLANGCYYRVTVVYKTAIKVGQHKVLFFEKDDIDYKKTAEVYEFYLHDNSANGQDDVVMSKTLGSVTNTGKDTGYYETHAIDIEDPHYGWEIGNFFVSGYTREASDDTGTPVFLKNIGDQVTLWFNLKQDIDKLNGDSALSICDDTNGYDQYFQTEKMNMGQGTLIIRYTDEKGVKHEPEIYTDYLRANASTSADTIVKLFEEGDYEIALDYEIINKDGLGIISKYNNYRIYFKFSVRNGNCMVYPFDVVTGNELSNEAITPNGFALDMAKSRYLTIDVKKSVVSEGANGLTEDVRFNGPAKDGDKYTDDGIYVFTVKNQYTEELTKKTIYVGSADYMKALSDSGMSVSQLNATLELGATIEEDGTIIMPSSSNKPIHSEKIAAANEPVNETAANAERGEEEAMPVSVKGAEESVTPTKYDGLETDEESGEDSAEYGLAIPIIIGSITAVIIVFALVKRKKTVKEGAK